MRGSNPHLIFKLSGRSFHGVSERPGDHRETTESSICIVLIFCFGGREGGVSGYDSVFLCASSLLMSSLPVSDPLFISRGMAGKPPVLCAPLVYGKQSSAIRP